MWLMKWNSDIASTDLFPNQISPYHVAFECHGWNVDVITGQQGRLSVQAQKDDNIISDHMVYQTQRD